MLSILSLQSAAHVAKVAVPSPLLRARRSVMMLDPPTGVQHLSSLLAEGAETIGPVLIAQMGVSGGMCAGGPRHCSDAGRHTTAPLLPCRFAAGTALHSGVFGEVDEPEEPSSVEGEVDIYRDSPLRYVGARRFVPPQSARPPRRLGLPSAQSAPGGAASGRAAPC